MKRNSDSKRKNILVKEQVKGMQPKHRFRKQLDTIVYPQTNHTIVYQGCSWTTPLKNCLGDVFLMGFNKASYILGNWAFLRITRKMKLSKRKQTLAKEKVKGMFQKTSPQEAAGHNSVPPNKPHYCVSGLLMDYPLEKLFG